MKHPSQPNLTAHHTPNDFSDRFALCITKLLRWSADTFFAKRYGHRAIVLETVAAVPGMVGATLTHLRCLRRMEHDNGWIHTLMEEAENERMHLMTFVEVAKPTIFERIVILLVQWFFYIGFFILYLISPKTAHRLVGYFEEEAVISYTLYLNEIDAGRSPNVPAPLIARQYWGLSDKATLRDVVKVVRADEAHHRDVNHGFAEELTGNTKLAMPSPYPWHSINAETTPQRSFPYLTSSVFTEDSLPTALKRRHSTADGVWGIIRVNEGSIKLTHLDTEDEYIIDSQTPGYVSPQQPHCIEPLGHIKVRMEFYEQDPRVVKQFHDVEARI